MGSRRFFFFLPEPGVDLNPGAVIAALRAVGFEFDSTAIVAGMNEWGVAFGSRQIKLGNLAGHNVSHYLQEGLSFEVECRDRTLFMNCVFGSPHPTPIFFLIVSLKRWSELNETGDNRYEQLMVQVARASGAVNVLVADEPSDDFLGRMMVVEQQWMVDPHRLSGIEMEALTVLTDPARGGLPVMRALRPTGRSILGFLEYRESLECSR